MQKNDLSGHLAIVTGAASGIGACFAREIAARGAGLIVIDINEQGLKDIQKSIISNNKGAEETKIEILPLNLADDGLVEKIEGFCLEHHLEPDILINNAGIFSFDTIASTSERKIETFIDLHVRCVTLLSRWFASRRMKNDEGETSSERAGSGWILNMSSMSCWMPMPGLAMYSATKSYIRVFSRSLHYELKDHGIGVTVACPGGIATDLFGLPENLKRLAVRLKVLDTPESFVRKAIDRMLKKKKQYINGLLNRLSIFFVGITPTPVRMAVKHRLLDKGIRR